MRVLIIIFFIVMAPLSAQNEGLKTDFYSKNGSVLEGYDLVSYFNHKPVKGNEKFVLYLRGYNFKFSSKENLEKFKSSPDKYLPQYGGYCAYAIAERGKKVSVDLESFEIRDGKLYLFYNSWGVSTHEKWKLGNPKALQEKADRNWKLFSTND